MKIRSLLYVPASEERFISKAHTRGADAIILDLEDSVLPEAKDTARDQLANSIASVGQYGAKVIVRINADPQTAIKDTKAAILAGAFGLYVAKANPNSISKLNTFLDEHYSNTAKAQIRLIPMIEDAAALLAAQDIATLPRVMALVLGGEDFATSLGAAPDADVLRDPKLLVHYAAKAQGHMSFGLFRSVADYTDTDAIAKAANEAKRFGFDGASCVHPSAVSILNRAFSPSALEIDWAQRVLRFAEQAGKGAFEFEGMMIDAPVLARAEAILDAS